MIVDEAQPAGWRDQLARQLRGFGPIGILALVIIYAGSMINFRTAYLPPLTAILILIWAWVSYTPWREIGFKRPASWALTIIAGLLLGCGLKLLMKIVVMPLLGAPPRNAAFQFLVGNSAVLPEVLYLVLVGAAFGEEVLFRGFAFERLGKLLGPTTSAKTIIVVLTAIWFGLEHWGFQGLPGVQQALIVGLIYGAIYARTEQLWLLIISHAAFDLTAVAMIYWDREEQFARLLFS